MNRHSFVLCMFALLLVAGCASTEIYNRQKIVTGRIPRPAHVWVYDFGATPEDVPADSALAGQYSRTPHTRIRSRLKPVGSWVP